MYKIIIIFILSLLGLFISCGEDDTDEVLGPGGSPVDPNQALLYLNMDDEDEYILSVNGDNFNSVSTISFSIGFHSTVFSIENITQDLSVSNVIGPYYSDNNVSVWYELQGSISGSEKLLTIDLKLASGGNLKGTDIWFGDIIFLDADDNYLYYSCSESSYETPEVCRDNGGTWDLNTDELSLFNICYIDKGIINQATVNTTEPMTDWEPTGDYIWSNAWCPYE